jgi:hypothetical protein
MSPANVPRSQRILLSRRRLLQAAGLAPLAAWAQGRKRVATVITEYRRNAHADVIVGRLLGGYEYYGEVRRPRVEVVSMYTDQVPANDMSRAMAAKHGVTIHPTVREALTLGGERLAVEGVVLIGEHGNYPDNEKGQKLYPRYELFEQIVKVFEASGRAVPVFSDKHLSVEWKKAKWMYDQSRRLGFPLLAGSSLPVTWRRPELELPMEAPVERAVAAFYGGTESYGFHALEALQCMVERRRGGETGMRAVQTLEGGPVWEWTDSNPWAKRLLETALARSATRAAGSPRDTVKRPVAFLLEYRSGLQAAVYMLNGHVRDCTFACDLAGSRETPSTLIWLQSGRPYSHFSGLTHYIEELIATGKAPYPVERTLLTTGTLEACIDSAFRGHVRLETPHLEVAYRAVERSLYNRGAVPKLEEG